MFLTLTVASGKFSYGLSEDYMNLLIAAMDNRKTAGIVIKYCATLKIDVTREDWSCH